MLRDRQTMALKPPKHHPKFLHQNSVSFGFPVGLSIIVYTHPSRNGFENDTERVLLSRDYFLSSF